LSPDSTVVAGGDGRHRQGQRQDINKSRPETFSVSRVGSPFVDGRRDHLTPSTLSLFNGGPLPGSAVSWGTASRAGAQAALGHEPIDGFKWGVSQQWACTLTLPLSATYCDNYKFAGLMGNARHTAWECLRNKPVRPFASTFYPPPPEDGSGLRTVMGRHRSGYIRIRALIAGIGEGGASTTHRGARGHGGSAVMVSNRLLIGSSPGGLDSSPVEADKDRSYSLVVAARYRGVGCPSAASR
jgi:hypothetical protein